MTIEADALISNEFLEGVAQGNQHSIAQLRTVFDSMKNQIGRLEANNHKLRGRVKILLQSHAELERNVVELKAQRTQELDDATKEIGQLQNELEKLRRESASFNKQSEAAKVNFEISVAERNRILIEIKAENLILKDKLEEQGLQFAQQQSRSAITKDLINEVRENIASVVKIQVANQEMLEKYSKQVCNANQECLELKTANEELRLVSAAKDSSLESHQQRIKDLEELKASGYLERAEGNANMDFIVSATNDFRQHISDMKMQSKKHIEEFYQLAAFTNTELKKFSHRSFAQEGPVEERCQDSVHQLEAVPFNPSERRIEILAPELKMSTAYCSITENAKSEGEHSDHLSAIEKQNFDVIDVSELFT